MGDRKIVFFYLIVIFFGNTFLSAKEVSCLIRQDTIGSIYNDSSYYKHKNLIISKNYQIIDSASYSLKNDTGEIFFLILSSPSKEEAADISDKSKRLMVILKRKQDSCKILAFNENIVLNYEYGDYVSDFISVSKDGFSLNYSFGSINKCDIFLFFEYHGKFFLLNKIEYHCWETSLCHGENYSKYYNCKENMQQFKYVNIYRILENISLLN